jgi:hypothetical protein
LPTQQAGGREQDFLLTGFSGKAAHGRCTVVSFDRAARWWRALRSLGKWWGLTLVCVFIPVAHVLLVPAFVTFGLYQFVQRLGTTELAYDAHGTCPDCGAAQPLEIAPQWRAPQEVVCPTCRRGLTLSVRPPS